MVIKCKIYFEAYTASGTRHAPYSTSCGHVMGKECLERFRECSNGDYFNCPFCSGNIKFSDCHPIYDIVEEFKDNDEKSKNIIRKLKKDKNFPFLKDFYNNIDGNIHFFFDEHMGYILIAGETSSVFTHIQFIKLTFTKGKNIYYINIYT